MRFDYSDHMDLILGAAGGVEDFQAEFSEARSGTFGVANVFQEFNWQPFEKATFMQTFNAFVNPSDSEQFSYDLAAAFRYRLTDLFGIEVSLKQEYDNDVVNGNERDETRWENAIVVYF